METKQSLKTDTLQEASVGNQRALLPPDLSKDSFSSDNPIPNPVATSYSFAPTKTETLNLGSPIHRGFSEEVLPSHLPDRKDQDITGTISSKTEAKSPDTKKRAPRHLKGVILSPPQSIAYPKHQKYKKSPSKKKYFKKQQKDINPQGIKLETHRTGKNDVRDSYEEEDLLAISNHSEASETRSVPLPDVTGMSEQQIDDTKHRFSQMVGPQTDKDPTGTKDYFYDQELAQKELKYAICQLGFRPPIPEDTPPALAILLRKSWDTNPDLRPTAEEFAGVLELLHVTGNTPSVSQASTATKDTGTTDKNENKKQTEIEQDGTLVEDIPTDAD